MSDPNVEATAPASSPAGPASPVSWPTRVVIVLGLALGVVYNLVRFPGSTDFGWVYRIDLDVYRVGGGVWRDGDPLYGQIPDTASSFNLPFTYPPLAAVVFSPLTIVPLVVASVLITLVTIAMMGGTVRLWLGTLRDRLPRDIAAPGGFGWTVAAVTAVALWIEPVRETLDFGQVNAILMLLVAADVLLPRTVWPRGLLIGLVTAVKLTPAVFALYFLVRRDTRAFLTTIVSFLLFSAIGALAAPRDSVDYWFDTLIDSDRIGNPEFVSNQSITGVIARLGVTGTAGTALWLVVSLIALGVAVIGMVRGLRADRPDLALGINALLGLLVSPVSWTHHWVWVVPIFVSLAVSAYRAATGPRMTWIALLATGLVVFIVAPQWYLPNDGAVEVDWSWWQQIVGSLPVWWAIVALIAFTRTALTDAAPPAVRSDRGSDSARPGHAAGADTDPAG